MNQEQRVRLLTAWGLAEMHSIYVAMSRLGDAETVARAAEVRVLMDSMALRWADVSGVTLAFGGPDGDRLLDLLIEQARSYVTEHVEDLDVLINEIAGRRET